MRYFFSRQCCTCILLLALILNSFRAASQEHFFYTEQADTILQNLDKGSITTGILYDRAFPMSRFDAFDPVVDTSGYLPKGKWRKILPIRLSLDHIIQG